MLGYCQKQPQDAQYRHRKLRVDDSESINLEESDLWRL